MEIERPELSHGILVPSDVSRTDFYCDRSFVGFHDSRRSTVFLYLPGPDEGFLGLGLRHTLSKVSYGISDF